MEMEEAQDMAERLKRLEDLQDRVESLNELSRGNNRMMMAWGKGMIENDARLTKLEERLFEIEREFINRVVRGEPEAADPAPLDNAETPPGQSWTDPRVNLERRVADIEQDLSLLKEYLQRHERYLQERGDYPAPYPGENVELRARAGGEYDEDELVVVPETITTTRTVTVLGIQDRPDFFIDTDQEEEPDNPSPPPRVVWSEVMESTYDHPEGKVHFYLDGFTVGGFVRIPTPEPMEKHRGKRYRVTVTEEEEDRQGVHKDGRKSG